MKNINNLKPPCPPPVKNNIALPNNINIRYAYLPNGDRIMRANSTDTEYYLYDREDRIGDYDENGNLLIAYTHGPGIDEPLAMTISGSTYFYIPDIQGSIRAIVDMNGNLMASYVYDVWGTLISYNGTLAEKNDYLYTGREYDWETGIYYYRARSYDAEIGRFLQQDPEGMVDGPNMYVYVKNDPGNGVDAWGKWFGTTCVWSCISWNYVLAMSASETAAALACVGTDNGIIGTVAILGAILGCASIVFGGGTLAIAACILTLISVSYTVAVCIARHSHVNRVCLKYGIVCGRIPFPRPHPI